MMKNLCAVSFLVASLYAGNVYAQALHSEQGRYHDHGSGLC